MQKKMFCTVCALFFIVGAVSAASAATLRCTIDSVEGDKVTMTCDKADQLSAGDEIKVRPPKKGGAAIEGC
ncbi:MAG TPA: hypothetical protein DDX99_01910 [Desulfofustis sp.]|jgi:RNase P subunit RPR2|nr:hypothetical protein [Desulfofustis sp.]